MRLNLSIFIVAALSFCAVATLGGWIEDRPDGGTVIHVSLWWMPDASRTDPYTRAEIAAIREFVRRFPEKFTARYREKYRDDRRHNWDRVEVRLEQATGIRIEGIDSDLLAIAGGVAPDILYVNFRKSDSYIQQGLLLPLDDYVQEMTPAEIAFRVFPKLWPVIKRAGPGGTHVWALPWGGPIGLVMLYRKDLFDAAGVPYPQPGWTWEDLYAACRKISDPSRGVHGLQLAPGRQEAWSWQSFLSSTDDSRAAATALDFYTKLCTERWIDRHGRPQRGYVYKTDDPTKWDRGEIALSFSYIEERVFGTLDPDVTGMVPVPIGPRGQRGGEFNSRMMGLFAGIRELAVRDAAWEYLRWIDSPEAVALKLRVLVEGGMGRQINPKYLAMFGYDDLVQLAPKGWAETAQIAIDTGTPEPYGPNCSRIYDFMSVPLQRAEQLALHDKLPASEPARLEVLQSLLREAAAKANRELFGHVPAAERAARRLSAIVLLAVALVVGTVAAMRVAHSFRPTRFAEERRRARAYLLLVPAVVLVLVWQYLPLAWGSLLAFQDFRIMGGSRWVWLDNFGAALWNGDWWRTVWNTLRYSTLVMALTFLPPVGLALALQEVRRGGAVLRALYYMPAMISGLVTILLWRQFCDPSETGLLNSVWLRVPAIVFVALGVALAWIGWRIARRLWFHQCRWQAWLCLAAGVWLGYTCAAWAGPALARTDAAWWARLFLPAIEPRRWLTDPETALACCVLPLVWMGLGPGSLIYLAGLKSVGDELYEAGEIDGATTVDKVLFIVLPVLRPLLVINFIGVFIASWQSEASVLAMTGGAGDTEVAGLHIFYEAFLHLRFGPAAAMAWMLGFMLLGVMAQQLRLLGRAEFRTMGKER